MSSRTARPPGATTPFGCSTSPRWKRTVAGTLPGTSVSARTNSSTGFFFRTAAAASVIVFNSAAAFASYRYSNPADTFRLGCSCTSRFCSGVRFASGV